MNVGQFFDNGKLFDDGQCSICFSAPQIEKSGPPCGHIFCCQCLTEWNKYEATCPICKNEFTKIARINGKNQITTVQNAQVEKHIRFPSIPSEHFNNIFIILTMVAFCLGILTVRVMAEMELDTRFSFPSSKIFKGLFIVWFVYHLGAAYEYGFIYLRVYTLFSVFLCFAFVWA